MRLAVYLLGLGVVAAGVSFGVSGLQAQQSTLLNFCPAKPGSISCSAAATMLVSAGKPTDDELVAYIIAIANAQRAGGGCADTAAGLQALVGAINAQSTKGLAQQVAARLCGATTAVASTDGGTPGADLEALHDIIYGTDKGTTLPTPPPAPPPVIISSSSSGGGSD